MEDYSDLKRKLRVKNEFCIYLEGEEGNLIEVRGGTRGIGSRNIELDNTPCGLGLNEAEKAACQVAHETSTCDQTGTLPFTPPLTAERCCAFEGW